MQQQFAATLRAACVQIRIHFLARASWQLHSGGLRDRFVKEYIRRESKAEEYGGIPVLNFCISSTCPFSRRLEGIGIEGTVGCIVRGDGHVMSVICLGISYYPMSGARVDTSQSTGMSE